MIVMRGITLDQITIPYHISSVAPCSQNFDEDTDSIHDANNHVLLNNLAINATMVVNNQCNDGGKFEMASCLQP